MNMRTHTHEEVFAASPEEVFALLHKPSAIRQWWGAARAIVLPRAGGFWCATWGASEDTPDYITWATIKSFDPPRLLVLGDYQYYAHAGPAPATADFAVTFLVRPHPDGASLRVTQAGFPAGEEGDAFLEACVAGWKQTFEGIRTYLNIR